MLAHVTSRESGSYHTAMPPAAACSHRTNQASSTRNYNCVPQQSSGAASAMEYGNSCAYVPSSNDQANKNPEHGCTCGMMARYNAAHPFGHPGHRPATSMKSSMETGRQFGDQAHGTAYQYGKDSSGGGELGLFGNMEDTT